MLLLNEFDHDEDGRALALFEERYLAVGQGGGEGLRYAHRFTAPVNTGVPSGADLDHDGSSDGPGDAFGFGRHPGQYGMAVLSRLPIDAGSVRTFRELLWRDLPGALLPDDPDTDTPSDWYSKRELELVRLSSKSHWDVPIRLDGARVVHVLVSHPTPPVFDGPEDRNGRRNHDEIRLWADYLTPARASYLRDDAGGRGGLPEGEAFVIMGDQNADPVDGDSHASAIRQLLDHPRVQGEHAPRSEGAREQAALQGGANLAHRGDPGADTGNFADDPAPGNLRIAYVLPSVGLKIEGSGVFWPAPGDPDSELLRASDHRLVWVDLAVR